MLAPAWSLALEEQFYLIWPPVLVLLFVLGVRRRSIGIVLSVLAVVTAGTGWLFYSTPIGSRTPDIMFSPVFSVSPLLMGSILAFVLSTATGRRFFESRSGAIATWLGALAIVALVVVASGDWKNHQVVVGLVIPASAIASTILVGGLVSRTTVLSRIMSQAGVAWFGRNVSYSLYLWHLLVFRLVEANIDGLAGRVGTIVAAILVSVASYYLVERAVMAQKYRFEPAKGGSRRDPAVCS